MRCLLGTFYAWSLKIIPMADDHAFSFLDVFSFQFVKEILRYRRLSRRFPFGRRRLDPHLERHSALSDERPEERVDGGGHGQAELVQDGRSLLLDLRVDADRRGRYVRRHGLTSPRVSRCDHSTASMRRARPSGPCRAAPR